MKLEPCIACQDQKDSCCFNICSGYLGTENESQIKNSPCGKHCQACAIGEKGKCSSISLDKIPHYFPQYYQEGYSIEEAYKKCLEKAKGDDDATLYCKIDRDSLIENEEGCGIEVPTNFFNWLKKYRRKNPIAFWVGFTFTALLVILFLYVFIRVIVKGIK